MMCSVVSLRCAACCNNGGEASSAAAPRHDGQLRYARARARDTQAARPCLELKWLRILTRVGVASMARHRAPDPGGPRPPHLSLGGGAKSIDLAQSRMEKQQGCGFLTARSGTTRLWPPMKPQPIGLRPPQRPPPSTRRYLRSRPLRLAKAVRTVGALPVLVPQRAPQSCPRR